MSITKQSPRTIFLGGTRTEVNEFALAEIASPGHLVELDNNAGVIRWKKAVAATAESPAVLTEQSMLNKAYTDAYAAGDLAEVSIGHRGATFWMHIASGQNIAAGDKLESAGDGTLCILAAGKALFTALENKPNVTQDTMIRVEVL